MQQVASAFAKSLTLAQAVWKVRKNLSLCYLYFLKRFISAFSSSKNVREKKCITALYSKPSDAEENKR